MNSTLVDILYGIATAILGASVAWVMCYCYWRRKVEMLLKAEGRRNGQFLASLQKVAASFAFDVDEHSNQVQEINNELTAPSNPEAKAVVDVVAKLILANQQMQEKVASTEDKLRKQAKQIEAHATEARTDSVTLLANRRAFDDEQNRRFAELVRQGRIFSIVMVDLDRFKEINDLFGHQAGDLVLRQAAELFRRQMRDMDLVARYGGDEFGIVLPGTNLGEACNAATRAAEAIDRHRFRYEGREILLTASIGVAQAVRDEDFQALMSRADKALYAAKDAGRDCIYCHDGKTVRRIGMESQPNSAEPVVEAGTEPALAAKNPGVPTPPKTAEPSPKVLTPRVTKVEGLIDLPNRTTFCQQVRSRAAEWKRGGPVFSIILLEFKQLEQAAERPDANSRKRAQTAAARFLTETLREMDNLANYAPTSFAILLPTAQLADAVRAADRLRQQFSGQAEQRQDEQLTITLSAGVVQITQKDDYVSVLKRAESALDAAVRRGGSHVYYHDGNCCAPAEMIEQVACLLA